MTCRVERADYRDILADVPPEWTIITDPPYGIGFRYDEHDDSAAAYADLLAPLRPWTTVGGIALLQYPENLIRDVVPVLGPPDKCLAWCYPSNTARQFRLWGLWGVRPDFSRVKQPARNPECEKVKSAVVDSYDWWEQPQVKNVSAEKTAHPCQIPQSMVERIIRLLAPAGVFDPFTGSGTAAAACASLGVPFIGAEKSAAYHAIAAARAAAAAAQMRMFA